MKHLKRSPAFPLEPNPSHYCYVGGKRKKKYVTEIEAEVSAPVRTLQQYECEFCGYWHNGNSSLQENVPK